LLEQIEIVDGWMFFKVDLEFILLLERQVIRVLEHEFWQATLPFKLWIDARADS